jgi:hypothetical protein
MNKDQALTILLELAYKAELPKGVTGIEASNYLQTINEAKTILESFLKEKKEDK